MALPKYPTEQFPTPNFSHPRRRINRVHIYPRAAAGLPAAPQHPGRVAYTQMVQGPRGRRNHDRGARDRVFVT